MRYDDDIPPKVPLLDFDKEVAPLRTSDIRNTNAGSEKRCCDSVVSCDHSEGNQITHGVKDAFLPMRAISFVRPLLQHTVVTGQEGR